MPVIGISIGLPDPWAAQIQDRRRSYGDPLADVIHTHITLVPPTEVAGDQLEALHRHLSEVARGHRPFEVQLRGTGTFRPVSPVVYLRLAQGAAECAALSTGIRTGPFRRDLEFAYHPHVTIAHHVAESAMDQAMQDMADYELSFTVAAFQVYEQDASGMWRQLHTVPLG